MNQLKGCHWKGKHMGIPFEYETYFTEFITFSKNIQMTKVSELFVRSLVVYFTTSSGSESSDTIRCTPRWGVYTLFTLYACEPE